MTVGQKDPCPCGSGKKYKHCHALKDRGKKQAGWIIPVAVFVVGFGLIYFVSHGKGAQPVATSAPVPIPSTTTTTTQPANVPVTSSNTTVQSAGSADQSPLPNGATPKPWQFDAPRNRYWHPGHGHWHDGAPPPEPERAAEMTQAGARAPDQSPLPGGVTPSPNYYDAAKDRYWSAEHGHWHTGHPVPVPVSTSTVTVNPTVTATPVPAKKTP